MGLQHLGSIFTEHLLCVRHCSGHLGYTGSNNEKPSKIPTLIIDYILEGEKQAMKQTFKKKEMIECIGG